MIWYILYLLVGAMFVGQILGYDDDDGELDELSGNAKALAKLTMMFFVFWLWPLWLFMLAGYKLTK